MIPKIELDIDPDTGEFIPEVWKDIPGYSYIVSNYGRIYGLKRKNVLRCGTISKGYLGAGLCKDGKMKTFKVHRLIMAIFDKPSTLHVDHIDEDKTNNRFLNLRYCTNHQNITFHHQKKKKYVGVNMVPTTGKWFARIRINNEVRYLGTFSSEYEAHKAYQRELQTRS